MRKRLILAAVALLCPFTWAAPALAQACYGESYPSYSYGGAACYSGSAYSYGYTTGPAYSATGSYTYAAPIATVGSRMAYRAFHPLAGLRGRVLARRALRGTYGVGGACYSEGYGGGYGGGACYSASYGGGYASYYAAPAHYHVALMAYATPAYATPAYATPAYQPATWAAPSAASVPVLAPAPAPSPQVGTHPCPCGDAACNHTLGSCPCTDAGCRCHLPWPTYNPNVAPVTPPAPAPVVPPAPNVTPHHPDRDRHP
jgi:hypothetical protein